MKTPPETPLAKRRDFGAVPTDAILHGGLYPRACAYLDRLDFAAGDRSELAPWRVDFPTACALLEAWEKPWATRLVAFAARRLELCLRAGLDILEA